MKNISILGSTGSIGTQTLDVVRNINSFNVIGLAANSNISLLEKQIREFKPKLAAVYDASKAEELKYKIKDTDTKVLSGMEGLTEISANKDNDLSVVAVSGMIGLIPTIEALRAKIDVAIATKEVLVAAGKIVTDIAKKYNAKLIPIDSEHSAIMQCIQSNKAEIKKIILTASGGPFRGKKLNDLQRVTVESALKHPNWSMGKKISIDSATMMNKGLEVIEARWLFDMEPEKIQVLVHPQSIVHSMVEYIDGSIIAQMGPTDMRLPIQYALSYPKRVNGANQTLSLVDKNLTFENPDKETFKALDLAYKALSVGGTMPTVLNASNEIAVELFLNKKISFLDITKLVERCMEQHEIILNPNIDDILNVDQFSRKLTYSISEKYIN